MNQVANGSAKNEKVPLYFTMGVFLSSFDRIGVSPVLFLLAIYFGVPLSQVLPVAGIYFLTYGLSQPVWGILSDRLGRTNTVRIALLGTAIGGLASAFAPSLETLIAFRGLTGIFAGAVVPLTAAYVGDHVAPERRRAALSDVMAFLAAGTTVGTFMSAVIAASVSWRLAFGVTAVGMLLCFIAAMLARTTEAKSKQSIVVMLVSVAKTRWVWIVISIGFFEGFLLVGLITLLAPALQFQGVDTYLAGFLMSAYGLANFLGTRWVRLVTSRYSHVGLLTIGGSAMLPAFIILAITVTPWTVLIAAILLGIAMAFVHTVLQNWSIFLLPSARGTVTALFSSALFTGASAGAALSGPAVEAGSWSELFFYAVILGVLFLITTFGSLYLYRRSRK